MANKKYFFLKEDPGPTFFQTVARNTEFLFCPNCGGRTREIETRNDYADFFFCWYRLTVIERPPYGNELSPCAIPHSPILDPRVACGECGAHPWHCLSMDVPQLQKIAPPQNLLKWCKCSEIRLCLIRVSRKRMLRGRCLFVLSTLFLPHPHPESASC